MFEHKCPASRHLPRNMRAGLWIAAAMFCAGCASTAGNDAAVAPQGMQQRFTLQGAEPQASLHVTLQQLAIRYGICNVTAAVIRNREVQSVEAIQGCAGEPPLAPESVFEAASLSKPVFAYAVLKLVQQGRMDLDTPVLKYLPDGYEHRFQAYLPDSKTDRVSDPRLQAVTVRMALNHTTGLPNWADGPLIFAGKPGEKWEYSGEGYVLLQHAVEAVTHKNLDDFMAHQVFQSLGMTHSAYKYKPEFEQYIVPGSNRDGVAMKPWPFRVPVAAFTLYTSARDYGQFLAALLKDEPILRQIVASPVPVNPKLNLAWGLGWGIEQDKDDVSIWHWGNNPGYRAFVMASPRSGNGFVMFTNSDNGLAIAEPFGEKILPGPHPVYRFHLLREGLANLLCETLGVCV